ncbi:hypothetical protein ACFOYW_10875 [Gryllotalpicola reticulitermitis]|uniref:Uncharacterized protein n=1 Tax=Gryllotalpicola reticulitermitis TaxID=1184153 RepID=A0ABV8Q6D4_9MICO
MSDDHHPTDASGAPSGQTWMLPVCLVVAIVLPVAILAALIWVIPPPPSGFEAAARPVGTPVQTATDSGLVGAVGVVTWRNGPTLFAPEWSGLVTEVRTHSGATVTTGSPVAVVDGVVRVAVATTTAFYRALSVGDNGADVTMLRQALDALGIGSYGQRSVFDSRLETGVGRLCRQLGCDPACDDVRAVVVRLPTCRRADGWRYPARHCSARAATRRHDPDRERHDYQA